MRGWLVIVMLTIGAGWAGEPAKKDSGKKEEAKKNPQVEAALSLIKAKQWEGAKTILEQVVKEDPKNIDATMALAQCEENLKNAGKATELYYKVIELVVADEVLHESADGKAIVEKCKKALVKLDEGAAIIRKHAEEMEKEALALKGKNEFAYNQVMKWVKEMKGPDDVGPPVAKVKFAGIYNSSEGQFRLSESNGKWTLTSNKYGFTTICFIACNNKIGFIINTKDKDIMIIEKKASTTICKQYYGAGQGLNELTTDQLDVLGEPNKIIIFEPIK